MTSARAVKSVLVVSAIALAGGAVALLGSACGGSSSESPWPIEPENPVLGPAGEDGKPLPLDQIPDAGADAAPTVEP